MTKSIAQPALCPAPALPVLQSACYDRARIDWYGADNFELTLTCGFGGLRALADAALEHAANIESLWLDVDDPRAAWALRDVSILRELAESILCARGRLS